MVNLGVGRHKWSHQIKSDTLRCYFSLVTNPTQKLLRYLLIPSRDIYYQRTLQSDWTPDMQFLQKLQNYYFYSTPISAKSNDISHRHFANPIFRSFLTICCHFCPKDIFPKTSGFVIPNLTWTLTPC